MAKVRHVASGVIVNTPDDNVARLGRGWVLITDEPPPAPTVSEPPKRRPGRPRKNPL